MKSRPDAGAVSSGWPEAGMSAAEVGLRTYPPFSDLEKEKNLEFPKKMFTILLVMI